MEKQAWLFVADKDTWLDVAERKTFGIEKSPGSLPDAKRGDPVVAYVKGECLIAGIGKLTSSYYEASMEEMARDLFPNRVHISIKLDFNNTVDIRKLIDKLDFITNKDNWQVHLGHGCGVVKISSKDYETIKKELEH